MGRQEDEGADEEDEEKKEEEAEVEEEEKAGVEETRKGSRAPRRRKLPWCAVSDEGGEKRTIRRGCLRG